MDPYRVLGVSATADQEEIRRAWLALARQHHPDHGGDPAAMQAVNEAWALLADPGRRRAWDVEHGRRGAPNAPPEAEAEVDADLLDLDRDLDPTPYLAPRRAVFDLVPVGLFALAVAIGCVGLAIDQPAMLGGAVFVFFLSCLGVLAAAMLSMRRSVRAGRR